MYHIHYSITIFDTIVIEVHYHQQTSIVGTWSVTQEGYTTAFALNADNTFSMDYTGFIVMSGTYTMSGTTITFTYTSCSVMGEPMADCGDPTVGTISGNQMTILNGDGTSMTLTKV
jgi:hypothetical protein